MLRNQFIVGTATSVGKNTIVCSLLSVARRTGISAMPFKPFAIDAESPETSSYAWTPSISHQSIAAGKEPNSDMNPVRFIYRTGDGNFASDLFNDESIDSPSFEDTKTLVRSKVRESLDRLKPFDVVICEGSGCVVDALSKDVFNSTVIEILDPDITLVANARNGGGYAQLVGTLSLMDDNAVGRVKTVVINEMTGPIQREIYDEFAGILLNRFGVRNVEIVPSFCSIQQREELYQEASDRYLEEVDFIADRMRVCAPSLFEFLAA